MHCDEAAALARELMDRHGLRQWTFAFDRARRRLGCCDYRRRRITLSRAFVECNDLAAVRDVVLHEIAHALTPGAGHGPRFKRTAADLGCSAGARVAPGAVVSPPFRYRLRCPHCGRCYHRYRKPSKALVCGPCLRSAPRAPGGPRPLRVQRLPDASGAAGGAPGGVESQAPSTPGATGATGGTARGSAATSAPTAAD